MAFLMAGSLASGLTVATYRSVLVTWLRVHTATTDSGASTQATTISSVATTVRQRWRAADRPPDGVLVGRPAAAGLGTQGRVLRPQPLQLGPLVNRQAGVLGHG